MSLPKAQLVDPQGNMNLPGMTATGIVTATSLSGIATGSATGLTGNPDLDVGIVQHLVLLVKEMDMLPT